MKSIQLKTTEKGKQTAIDLVLKGKMIRIFNSLFQDDEYGFEMFVLSREEPVMRHFRLDDKKRKTEDENGIITYTSFKERVRDDIKNAILRKFIGITPEEREKIHYDDGTNIADDQHTIYVFHQSDDYKPFACLELPADLYGSFSMRERQDIAGFFFRFGRGEKVLWAYQHLWNMAIPNRKKNSFLTKICTYEEGEVFEEMKDPLLAIAKKVDILVVGDAFITDNLDLLQRSFAFERYIDAVANATVDAMDRVHLVKNIGKVSDYVGRSNSRYKRKIMRISHSKVLQHSKEEIMKNISVSERWKDVFRIENGEIILDTFADVENVIDLFDERFTRSEITNEEYDTEVKKPAERKEVKTI